MIAKDIFSIFPARKRKKDILYHKCIIYVEEQVDCSSPSLRFLAGTITRKRNTDYVKFRRNPSLRVIDISAWSNKLFRVLSAAAVLGAADYRYYLGDKINQILFTTDTSPPFRGLILGCNWDKSLQNFPPCCAQSTLLTNFTPPPPWAKVVRKCNHCMREPQV